MNYDKAYSQTQRPMGSEQWAYMFINSQPPKTAWGVLTSKLCLRSIWGSASLHSPKVLNIEDYSDHSLVQKSELQCMGIKYGSV